MTSTQKLGLLSIIVPCFNEQEVIRETCERLLVEIAHVPSLDYELVFIDDGSTDDTLQILRSLQAKENRIRVISLSRNFGHQVALTAGLEHAAGDAVVVIDADLQDPPEVIHSMVERWQAGADVVYGVRTEREGETVFKRWTASFFYRFLGRVSDVPIPLDSGDFRLLDRKVVDALLQMPERDRFVRGMVAWLGFRQEPVTYRRAARFAGSTKYPLKKMLHFATDGMLSFSMAPLRLASWIGVIVALLSLMGILYALFMRLLTDVWVPGWTLLFIALLFIGGVQMLLLGMLGEYLGRIYGEVKGRPLYVTKERLGFPARSTASSSDKIED